ncbi:metal-dependent hydrolase [Aquimarina pacifica]|uniref:metal-dependent hydrolase n=1 Tax=Aquimarina pacifica TaxID=1296415 RepID=UPI0004725677|nr:metal-dependent hydrolase [Aquimarina pacifica]
MASIFAHAFTAYAFSKTFSKKISTTKFWMLGIVCAILPDADVISFKFGIRYEDFWGHRGFTHSFAFSILLGILVTLVFYRKQVFTKDGYLLILYFSICTASHALLDAMTTGGLGVAFFSPFDTTRYFFDWRPIQVSPIGIHRFLGMKGIKVLLSEILWVGIPGTIFILAALYIKKTKQPPQNE